MVAVAKTSDTVWTPLRPIEKHTQEPGSTPMSFEIERDGNVIAHANFLPAADGYGKWERFMLYVSVDRELPTEPGMGESESEHRKDPANRPPFHSGSGVRNTGARCSRRPGVHERPGTASSDCTQRSNGPCRDGKVSSEGEIRRPAPACSKPPGLTRCCRSIDNRALDQPSSNAIAVMNRTANAPMDQGPSARSGNLRSCHRSTREFPEANRWPRSQTATRPIHSSRLTTTGERCRWNTPSLWFAEKRV